MKKRISTQYFNGTLIVGVDGNVYTNSVLGEAELMEILQDIIVSEHTDEFIESVKERMGINDMFKTKKQQMREQNQALVDAVNNLPDGFNMVGDKVFYGDYQVTLPKILFERIVDATNDGDTEQVDMLVNFWKNALLNPNAVAREDLFRFLEQWDFKITPSGHFITFRQVHVKNRDEVIEYAENVYDKMKGWKRNPSNANIVRVDDKLYFYDTKKKDLNKFLEGFDEYDDYSVLGTARDLYENVRDSETVYTDDRTKTFNIRMLQDVTMPRGECDSNPNSSCSRGLHLGTPQFVSGNDFGSVLISALVHPRDVVAVPNHDSHKMRVCRYFPLEVIDNANDYELSDEQIEQYDSMVSEYISDELDQLLTNHDLEDLQESKTLPFELTLSNVENLQSVIDSRIIDITNV